MGAMHRHHEWRGRMSACVQRVPRGFGRDSFVAWSTGSGDPFAFSDEITPDAIGPERLELARHRATVDRNGNPSTKCAGEADLGCAESGVVEWANREYEVDGFGVEGARGDESRARERFGELVVAVVDLMAGRFELFGRRSGAVL